LGLRVFQPDPGRAIEALVRRRDFSREGYDRFNIKLGYPQTPEYPDLGNASTRWWGTSLRSKFHC